MNKIYIGLIITFLSFFALFFVFSCTYNNNINNFSELFHDIDNDSRRTLVFIFDKDTQIYKKTSDNQLVKIANIKKGEKGVLIANDLADDYTNDLYLCKVIGDKGLWTGWVKAKDIIKYTNKIDRYEYYHAGDFNHWGFIISNNNESIALAIKDSETPLINTLHIYTRYGKSIMSISTETLKTTYPNVCQISPLGWSSNDSKLWFVGLCDYSICIGKLTLPSHHIDLFDIPKNYVSHGALDFNNGILYYTDFPKLFDSDDIINVRKSHQKYSIYKQKLGSNKEEVLYNQVNNRFELFTVKNEKLVYSIEK